MKQKPIDLLDLTPDVDIEARTEDRAMQRPAFLLQALAGSSIANNPPGATYQRKSSAGFEAAR